jgi:glycosyltransferase involved in cell wall biosynthesis
VRVLIVTRHFPPFGVTGVERVAEQTALALRAAGDDVTVLFRRETPAPPALTLQPGMHRGIRTRMIAGGGPLHARFPRFAPRLERLFERVLLEAEPDVVLCTHLMDHSPGYVSIAHRWQVPVALELHDYYTVCEWARLQRPSGELCPGPNAGDSCATYCFGYQERARERWALRTHMFRRALERADALVAPSRFVADYYARHFGESIPEVRVIGNGVALNPPAPRPADPPRRELKLAYVGTVVRHKGVHVLIDALRQARLPAVTLDLFGLAVPEYVRELHEAARDVDGLTLRVYGAYEPEALSTLLDGVDIVVQPSLVTETFSIVVREAFACGIPVIASRIGALPEGVRDGENGLLFNPGSGFELARHLQTLDADRALLRRLAAGIRPADWISVPERAARMRSILTEIAAHPPDSRGAHDELAELDILRDSLSEQALRRDARRRSTASAQS